MLIGGDPEKVGGEYCASTLKGLWKKVEERILTYSKTVHGLKVTCLRVAE